MRFYNCKLIHKTKSLLRKGQAVDTTSESPLPASTSGTRSDKRSESMAK